MNAHTSATWPYSLGGRDVDSGFVLVFQTSGNSGPPAASVLVLLARIVDAPPC
jgi:hypothetical protein